MTGTAELIARLRDDARERMAAAKLFARGEPIGNAEDCISWEAAAALAAQAQEIARQNSQIREYQLANFEQRFIEQKLRAEAAEARVKEQAQEIKRITELNNKHAARNRIKRPNLHGSMP